MVKSQLLYTTSRSRRFSNLQHYYSHFFGFFMNSVKGNLHLVLYHDRIQAVMRHFVESRPRDLRLCCDLQHRDLKGFAGVNPWKIEDKNEDSNLLSWVSHQLPHSSLICLSPPRSQMNLIETPTNKRQQFSATVTDGSL